MAKTPAASGKQAPMAKKPAASEVPMARVTKQLPVAKKPALPKKGDARYYTNTNKYTGPLGGKWDLVSITQKWVCTAPPPAKKGR